MDNKRFVIITAILVVALYLLTVFGINIYERVVSFQKEQRLKFERLQSVESSPLNGKPLKDNPYAYPEDNDKMSLLYLTTYPSTNKGENKVTVLTDINDIRASGSLKKEEPRVEVLFRELSTDGAVLFGDTAKPNGIMTMRGRSSRLSRQKSYRIKLYENNNLWRGESVINLNKHPYDLARILNKVSYDMVRQLPDMVAFNTKFAHVFLKDESKPKPDKDYLDYGLYTSVEQPDKEFLKRHGLDPKGSLYKANRFEFYEYKDKLKNTTDPGYNKDAFEEVLGIKAGDDHRKLLNMIKEVNDPAHNINDIINKYFNRNNYITWMATNIVLGNMDTVSQNFLLYSPQNSITWYFIPWDMDGTLQYTELEKTQESYRPETHRGICHYWGIPLHRRFFSYPQNIEALSKKIEEVYTIFSSQKTKDMINKYNALTENIILNSKDVQRMPAGVENHKLYVNTLQDIMAKNRAAYYKLLDYPMPIYMAKPNKTDKGLEFKWGGSQSLKGDLLTYDFQIAKDMFFNEVVTSRLNTQEDKFILTDSLPKGTYFWRVVITDSKGNKQIPFDVYRADNRDKFYGIMQFDIEN